MSEPTRTPPLNRMFEAIVLRQPEAEALRHGKQRRTYRQLNQEANRLARCLRKRGIGPEVLVGICLERSIELVVSVLGIAKAGGAYVPLDPNYPLERLRFMASDSRLQCVLTRRHLEDRFAKMDVTFLRLEESQSVIAHESPLDLEVEADPDNLAYVIYTSGSTGLPKATLITHRGLGSVASEQRRVLKVGPGSRVLQFSSPSFDAFVFEILMALASGGTLVLADRDELAPGPSLIRLLRKERITMVTLPPTALSALAKTDLPDLDTITVAGEACPAKLVEAWAPGRSFFNLYGPTETTIWAMVAKCSEAERIPPIGEPIANTQVYLLDEQMNPVPTEVVGELYIGGNGLARGYLNLPDLTAERFVPHPFGQAGGKRLYRTGDLCRSRKDGLIEFIWRNDEQVKVRGFRIELVEVTAALATCPGVNECAVVARDDEGGDKCLVGYIVPDGATPLQAEAVKTYLRSKLPEYMVPGKLVNLDRLPLTASGKLDRRALPDPNSQPVARNAGPNPRNSIEETLVVIWKDLFRSESIGVETNFFDLGGHSLLATRMINRIAEAFQVELTLSQVLAAPTIRELARTVTDHDRHGALRALSPIPRASRNQPLPLSFSQERVWFLHQLNPGNLAYHAQATFQFVGRLEVENVQRALDELLRRHEILRTTFPEVNGRPIQIVHAPLPAPLALIDLRAVPEKLRAAQLDQFIQEEIRKPFQLDQWPLVRWTLVRLAEQEHALVHVEHHLLHDGWSFNVFLAEFVALYRAFAGGQPSPLGELPLQFADFACWQREWMRGATAAAQLQFWKGQLAGIEPLLRLPYDRPRPSAQSFRGAALRIELPAELCEQLRVFSQENAASLFMTMLTGWAALVHRYSGGNDFIVGTGIANRRWRETEALMGMIINNLVLRVDVSGHPTFRELLGRVRGVTLDAYENQDLPFEKVVEILQPERDLSLNPLFQVMFSFHDAPMPSTSLPGLKVDLMVGLNNGSAKFDLTITVLPASAQRLGLKPGSRDNLLTLIWEYSTDLFDEVTIRRMAAHYRRQLEGAMADPDSPVSCLKFLTEKEEELVIKKWNATARAYPRDATIHELFEARVRQNQAALALVCGQERLSYGELNRRANQLAHYLESLGVPFEGPVGLYLHRSARLVVAILGILKAGAAYLPLDPDYPAERLRLMLRNSGAQFVLTEATMADAMVRWRTEAEVVQVVELDTLEDVIGGQNEENPAAKVTAENLAYILYTSGSTGVPKAVEVPHRSVIRLLFGVEYVRFGCEEKFLQLAPLSFDASTFELWGALLHGGTCVVVVDRMPDLLELSRMIQTEAVSVLWLTASLYNVLVDDAPDIFNPLTQLVIGGEALSVAHVRRGLARYPWLTLINGYGPTEGTTFTCCHRIPTAGETWERGVPIGRPIGNTTVYLLDEEMNPVPVGVEGELHIGGDGLARGYSKQAIWTADRFVPDPFATEPGRRLFRTGDMCRYRADGIIEFVGRNDDQVKVRGFRLELGEIETVLGEHPALKECAVVLRNQREEKRLIAYVAPRSQIVLSVAEVHGYLKTKLPHYLLPSVVVPLQALPRTRHGKIDRHALPAPEAPCGLRGEFTPPRTETERKIAEIWSELLPTKRMDVNDNFFQIGGQSLLAMQLTNRLRRVFQVELPPGRIFELPTIAALADHVDAALWASGLPASRSETVDQREAGEL